MPRRPSRAIELRGKVFRGSHLLRSGRLTRGGERQNVAKDRRRLNELRAAGWTVVFMTAAELHDRAVVVARIAAEPKAPRRA